MLDNGRNTTQERENTMTELSFGQDFPGADEAQWRALVEKALKGAAFEKVLMSESYDGLQIEPLYARAHDLGKGLAGLPGSAPFTRGIRERSSGRAWDIRQAVANHNAKQANALILEDLAGGVSSLILKIAAPGQAGIDIQSLDDLQTCLDGVQLDFAAIALDAGTEFPRAARHLQQLWRLREVADDKAAGAFHADPLGTIARTGGLPMSFDQAYDECANLVTQCNDIYMNVSAVLCSGIPYHEAGASEAQEIACLAASLVCYLSALDARGIEPRQSLPRIVFSLSADADLFMTIAKIRAARTVLWQIAKSSGAEDAAKTIHLTVQTSERMLAKHDIDVNILRNTLAAAAGALGGADAVSVLPHSWPLGLPDRFARRIARNTQIILQEESFLGQVLDPAGGSWFTERVSHELSHTAWTLFQKIEGEGGLQEALQKGMVQSMIKETAELRAKDIAAGRLELTGVSAFPHLCGGAETDITPHPVAPGSNDEAVTAEPLPLRRLAEPFEALRDASDAHLAASGSRPQIFLANIGTLKDFNARATYAKNFFAAGGIEAIDNEGFSSAGEAVAAFEKSGAKIACLCSNDDVYAGLGQEAARGLKASGAQHIYMAGRPGEARDALRGAGVDTFIFTGCNMLETLSETHYGLDIGGAQRRGRSVS